MTGRPRNNADSYADRTFSIERRDSMAAATLRHKLMSRYGMTVAEWQALRAKQDYRCAVCGVHEDALVRKLHVDHSHTTGVVRGLLCFACNTGIGKLKDDPALLRRAANYLDGR